MEALYSYIDIFATKGIEYLLVIGFLALIPIFWRILTAPSREREEEVYLGEWFRISPELYYHKGHTWALPEGDFIKIGMDDFAQKLIGKPKAFHLPKVGTSIYQGEPGWEVEIDGKRAEMLSPVSGEVIEINENLLRSPQIINEDPYSAWILKVRPKKSSLKNLLKGSLVDVWMDETIEKLRERVGENIGRVYQDGGIVVSGIARAIEPKNWDRIIREFLLLEE
jgi:glycine cleavage system H lipoate-binding protein